MMKYWSDKVTTLGLPQATHWELIRGEQGQRLYWLIRLSLASSLNKSNESMAKLYGSRNARCSPYGSKL